MSICVESTFWFVELWFGFVELSYWKWNMESYFEQSSGFIYWPGGVYLDTKIVLFAVFFSFILLLAQLCCFKGFSRVFSLSCRLLLIAERRFLWRIPDSLPGSKPRAGWCPAKRWPTSLVTRLARECWITEEKTHTCASTNTHTHMPCIQRPFCAINGYRGEQSDALSVKCCSNAWGMTSQP